MFKTMTKGEAMDAMATKIKEKMMSLNTQKMFGMCEQR